MEFIWCVWIKGSTGCQYDILDKPVIGQEVMEMEED
jgi:hypothetical protein